MSIFKKFKIKNTFSSALILFILSFSLLIWVAVKQTTLEGNHKITIFGSSLLQENQQACFKVQVKTVNNEPVENAKISIDLRSNKESFFQSARPIAHSVTDSSGISIINFRTPDESGIKEAVFTVTSEHGNDRIAHRVEILQKWDCTLNAYSTFENNKYKLKLFGMLKDRFNNRPIKNKTIILSGKTKNLNLTDNSKLSANKNRPLFENKKIKTDRSGFFHLNIPIEKNLSSLELTAEYSNLVNKFIIDIPQVRGAISFKAQIDSTTGLEGPVNNNSRSLNVECQDSMGRPFSGCNLKIVIPDIEQNLTGITDSKGQARFTINSEMALKCQKKLLFTASDIYGNKGIASFVPDPYSKTIIFSLFPLSSTPLIRENNRFGILTKYSDNTPAVTRMTFSSQTASTDDSGRAVIELIPIKETEKFDFSITDDFGNSGVFSKTVFSKKSGLSFFPTNIENNSKHQFTADKIIDFKITKSKIKAPVHAVIFKDELPVKGFEISGDTFSIDLADLNILGTIRVLLLELDRPDQTVGYDLFIKPKKEKIKFKFPGIMTSDTSRLSIIDVKDKKIRFSGYSVVNFADNVKKPKAGKNYTEKNLFSIEEQTKMLKSKLEMQAEVSYKYSKNRYFSYLLSISIFLASLAGFVIIVSTTSMLLYFFKQKRSHSKSNYKIPGFIKKGNLITLGYTLLLFILYTLFKEPLISRFWIICLIASFVLYCRLIFSVTKNENMFNPVIQPIAYSNIVLIYLYVIILFLNRFNGTSLLGSLETIFELILLLNISFFPLVIIILSDSIYNSGKKAFKRVIPNAIAICIILFFLFSGNSTLKGPWSLYRDQFPKKTVSFKKPDVRSSSKKIKAMPVKWAGPIRMEPSGKIGTPIYPEIERESSYLITAFSNRFDTASQNFLVKPRFPIKSMVPQYLETRVNALFSLPVSFVNYNKKSINVKVITKKQYLHSRKYEQKTILLAIPGQDKKNYRIPINTDEPDIAKISVQIESGGTSKTNLSNIKILPKNKPLFSKTGVCSLKDNLILLSDSLSDSITKLGSLNDLVVHAEFFCSARFFAHVLADQIIIENPLKSSSRQLKEYSLFNSFFQTLLIDYLETAEQNSTFFPKATSPEACDLIIKFKQNLSTASYNATDFYNSLAGMLVISSAFKFGDNRVLLNDLNAYFENNIPAIKNNFSDNFSRVAAFRYEEIMQLNLLLNIFQLCQEIKGLDSYNKNLKYYINNAHKFKSPLTDLMALLLDTMMMNRLPHQNSPVASGLSAFSFKKLSNNGYLSYLKENLISEVKGTANILHRYFKLTPNNINSLLFCCASFYSDHRNSALEYIKNSDQILNNWRNTALSPVSILQFATLHLCENNFSRSGRLLSNTKRLGVSLQKKIYTAWNISPEKSRLLFFNLLSPLKKKKLISAVISDAVKFPEIPLFFKFNIYNSHNSNSDEPEIKSYNVIEKSDSQRTLSFQIKSSEPKKDLMFLIPKTTHLGYIKNNHGSLFKDIEKINNLKPVFNHKIVIFHNLSGIDHINFSYYMSQNNLYDKASDIISLYQPIHY